MQELTFLLDFRGGKSALIINLILILAMIGGLALVKESWWYNTLLAYPVGMLLAYNRELFERVVQTHLLKILLGVILLFIMVSGVRPSVIFENLQASLFGILVVVLTMYVASNSPILQWLGRNLFPLYIFQRLPMMVLSSVCGGVLCTEFPNVYVMVCMVITILITLLYRRITIKVG